MESRAVSAVDSEDGARHVRRLGAGEEGDTGGDLLRAAEATHGDGGEEPRRSGAVGGDTFVSPWYTSTAGADGG